jgi:hypothetical protein
MHAKILLVLVLISFTAGRMSAQGERQVQTVPIGDRETRVLEFDELKYPLIAQYAPSESEGVEVFRVKLDDQGRVVEAEPLSGNDLLIPDCLANLKKWHFQPNAKKTAIIVYDLRVSPGECHSASSVFSFRQPNLAVVTGCFPLDLGRTFEFARLQRSHFVSNSDIRVIHFGNQLKYPSLARQARDEGVVVLKLTLNDKGAVANVLPLSGLPILIEACIANAKDWQFQANSERTVVLVYNFSLVIDDPGQVFFQPPNLVTITNSPIPAQP